MKKIISAVLVAALFFGLCSGGSLRTDAAAELGQSITSADREDPETAKSDFADALEQALAGRSVPEEKIFLPPAYCDMSMLLDDNGKLVITRKDVGNVPLGPEGTWTIFVYMCGSNLESDDGSASDDIYEMINASTGSNVRFVVQTGGSTAWQIDEIDPRKLERLYIQDGECYVVDEVPKASMADARTLAEFLKWGVEEFPAAKMGLVLWNHGGGSVSGVCFDDLYDNDSLTATRVGQALAYVGNTMGDKFEFVGFDACLMGTIEWAHMLATYARYMYCSQESEPGSGWDYTAIGSYLGQNPYADGKELGKVQLESYYDSSIGAGFAITFSIIDLEKIDAVTSAFFDFSKNLYEATQNDAVRAEVGRSIRNVQRFGSNNSSEGYTNMIDFKGLVNSCKGFVPGADEVISALKQAVVYCKNSIGHRGACGLSIFYPLDYKGGRELSIFGQVATSPYYLAFVDRTAYGISYDDTVSYDDSAVIRYWDFLWNYSAYFDEMTPAEIEEFVSCINDFEVYWSAYNLDTARVSELIDFVVEPHINENGVISFVLTENALENAISVKASVYMVSLDGEDFIELGMSVDFNDDWETGEFSDNFNGYWFSLPDAQPLAVYVANEYEGYDIYTCPIKLNGKNTNLRIRHDYRSETVTIEGVIDSIDDNGMSQRDIIPLKPGDEIKPRYEAYSIVDGRDVNYTGYAYIYQEGDEISFQPLVDSEYEYAFIIYDVYNDFYMSDYFTFEIKDGELYFYEQ